MNRKGLGWGILVIAFVAILILIIGSYFVLVNMANSAMGGDLTSTFSYGIFILFGVITIIFVALVILLRPSTKYPKYPYRLNFHISLFFGFMANRAYLTRRDGFRKKCKYTISPRKRRYCSI